MGSTVVKSDREEKVSTLDKKKGGKMRSQIINISILMGLLICLVPVHGKPSGSGADCSCSDKTVETNTELIIGNCLTKQKGKFWCYFSYSNPDCCQAKSSRLRGYCVNFDLCNSDFVDYNPNTSYASFPGSV